MEKIQEGGGDVSWIPAYTEYVYQQTPNEIKLITKNFSPNSLFVVISEIWDPVW